MNSLNRLLVVTALFAIAGCDSGGEHKASVSQARATPVVGCDLLDPVATLRALDRSQLVGSLGAREIRFIDRVACSEPYLDESVECEVPAGATIVWIEGVTTMAWQPQEFSYILFTPESVRCKVGDQAPES
ncbi:MAG: hypothetical protein KJO55_09670 [Gammaproteobacteria bacterium]|nr:hypothetical protein [Gammaproteobacteria bacterium]NND60094.1 hypothetical protein [Gammaproteobacteria bacterium]